MLSHKQPAISNKAQYQSSSNPFCVYQIIGFATLQVYRVKGGFAQEKVDQCRVVSLNDEEEQLLCRYTKQGRSHDGIWRIRPNIVPN